MRRIPTPARFRRRPDRHPWSEARLRQVREEALDTAYRAGLFR